MLVLPSPGDTVALRLRRKVRLLALRHLLTVRVGGLADLPRVQAAMTGLLRTDPEPLLEAIGGIDVLVPLLASASGAVRSDAAVARAVPHLLAGLAPHLAAAVTWRARGGNVGQTRPQISARKRLIT